MEDGKEAHPERYQMVNTNPVPCAEDEGQDGQVSTQYAGVEPAYIRFCPFPCIMNEYTQKKQWKLLGICGSSPTEHL